MTLNKQKLKALIIAAEDIIAEVPYLYNISSLPSGVMLINGKDLDSEMMFLKEELTGLIDSGTYIFINAHGNIDKYGAFGYKKGEHIIELNKNLIYSSAKLINKIEKLTKSPLKFFLDSCHSGDGTKYFMSELKSQSTLVTNSKEGNPSIASFSVFDHNYIINSLNKSLNPYEDFINLFDIKAAQYAKFITQKEVFKTNPDYKILTSPELTKNFLEQEVKRFIAFAENKKWNNSKLTFSLKEFSDSEIFNFSGNLFHNLCGLGERKFIKFITENIENNTHLKSYVSHIPSIDQPINIASIGGHIEIVKLLLLYGADINNQEKYLKSTPIISALFGGHIKLAEFLLEQNANINIIRTDGVSALSVAAKYGYLEIAKIILAKNAQIDQADNEGITAIHQAILNDKYEVVNFLLENKANINTSHYTGITPLCSASEKGSTKMIQLLLNHNSKINIICDQGDSPLIKAISSNSFESVKMLVENGACINFYTDNGLSPILYSIFKIKNFEIAKFLIKSGADTNLIPSIVKVSVINMLKSDVKYSELVEYISSVGSDVSNYEDPSCTINNHEISLGGQVIDPEININPY